MAELPPRPEKPLTNWLKVLPKNKHAAVLATLNTLQVRDYGDMP